MSQENEFILTVSCPDRTGIVHTISGALLNAQGNIIDSQQFGDLDTNHFFLRILFSLGDASKITLVKQVLQQQEKHFNFNWDVYPKNEKTKVLILVSKQGHCLNDILFRTHSGNLNIDIVGIVSNHTTHQTLAESYGIPFHHLPVNNDNRAEQEKAILKLVDKNQVELVVLARYMQILSSEMCEALNGKAINIHHSFLPSFKGARPYHQAYRRGVKLIGATAHYVTQDLDEGPIIAQDVERVDHRLSAKDLTQVGSDIESLVLARAVKAHVEHRVMLNSHRTIVFD